MKKILYILPNLRVSSGVTSVVMNYYRNINKKNFHIDFLVMKKCDNSTEIEIIENGSKVHYLKNNIKNYNKLIAELEEFFNNNKYDIVELHAPVLLFIFLKIAKRHNVKLRIVHAHSTIRSTNKFKNIINYILNVNMKHYANVLFACSDLSGKYWYKDSVNNANYKTITNGINVDEYKFDVEKRNEIRKQLNIEKNTVIGFVGRISKDKNLLFLIKVMKKLIDIDKNYKLVIVGDGKELAKIKSKCSKLKDNIIFLGMRDDVKDIMNCFDLLVLPSKREGLPMVALEAQLTNVPCYLSDTITKEVDIGKTIFIPLKVDKWVETIKMNNLSKFKNNCVDREKFNIINCAKKLESIYENYLNSDEV